MEIKNEALKSLYKDLVSGVWSFCPCTKDDIDSAFKKCDDELEKLQRNIKTFQQSNGVLLEANLDLAKKNKQLKDKCDDLDRSHKRLGDIRNRLAKENEDLKQQNYTLGQKCQAETNTREYWRLLSNGRGEKICKLMRENAELQRQIDILKQRDMVFVDLDSVKLTGMGELWAMIREVNSAPIEAIYGSGAFNNKVCVGTMVDMYTDVRDFIKEYKAWKGCAEEEKKEKEEEQNKQKCLDDMRDYLHKFCENRWCDGCPLSTDEFKCGRGYRFRKWRFPDNGAIPDEDLKRYYEKVRDWEKKEEEQSSDQMRNWLESFCEKKETCIGCPFESDEFKCGYGFNDRSVISDEELKKYYEVARATEKEHKLEYGDAVRLPWRDYDYMYIGPDEKEGALVRLFDPKNHAIVTTIIANVWYNGGKIILANEDDLRMIWKNKK